MNLSINDIAIVQSGIYSKFGQAGSATYLQANYFDEYGELKNTIKPNLVLNNQTEKHLLNEGDILFAAKGTKNFAVIVKNKMGPCVASSTFLVIRIKDGLRKKILPEFLVWLLNHPHSQSFLKSKAIGTGLPSITKKVLDDFKVEIPELTRQQNILIIDELRKKEKHIKEKIEELRGKQMLHLLINLNQQKVLTHGE